MGSCFFAGSYTICHFGAIPSFYVFAVFAVVIIGYRLFYIWETAVTDFYGVPVEDFAQFVVLGGVLDEQGEDDLATLVATLMLKGGLNHVTFRFLVLFSLHFLVGSVSHCRFGLYPLFFRASCMGVFLNIGIYIYI